MTHRQVSNGDGEVSGIGSEQSSCRRNSQSVSIRLKNGGQETYQRQCTKP